MTEPDDVIVCLEIMDERWPGYQNAKKIIRDEIVRLRKIEKSKNDKAQDDYYGQGAASGVSRGHPGF